MNNAVDSATQLREIPTEERTIEFLMNALRLKEGFSQNLFEVRTGNEFSVISSKISKLIESGFIETNKIHGEDFYCASHKGYRFLNTLLGEFL